MMNHKSLGFTIIELVTVIVLLGILTTVVLPKFTGSSSFEAHPYRIQLISALRLVQQRAMHQTNASDGYCHQLVIDTKRYGIPNRVSCTTSFTGWQPGATGINVESNHNVTFAVVSASTPTSIGFDRMGRPSNDCDGGCTINISGGGETIAIQIESEGYIHAL